MSTTQPLSLTVFTFALLLFTCLLGQTIAIYALWRIFCKNANELKNVDSIAVNTAASCISLHAFSGLLDPIGYYFYMVNDPYSANKVWFVWAILWTLSKLNLYFVYIYRCHITFKTTKYAHSPIKVYVPLCLAWLLQLLNGIVFVYHKLDQANLIEKAENPLSNDEAVIIASVAYLLLDLIIVLSVVFLFLNPIIHLMADLRTSSQMCIVTSSPRTHRSTENECNEGQIELAALQHNESSSTPLSPSAPHSPTKFGAATYYQNDVVRNTTMPVIRPNYSDTSSVVPSTTVMDSDGFRMKELKPLTCPEAEDEAIQSETVRTHKSSQCATNRMVWNEKQRALLNTGTRLALLSVISLSSGSVYQILWILGVGFGAMRHFTYTWSIDTVINIVCIYFSFQFAVQEYNVICTRCCRCHACCLQSVERMAKKRVWIDLKYV